MANRARNASESVAIDLNVSKIKIMKIITKKTTSPKDHKICSMVKQSKQLKNSAFWELSSLTSTVTPEESEEGSPWQKRRVSLNTIWKDRANLMATEKNPQRL